MAAPRHPREVLRGVQAAGRARCTRAASRPRRYYEEYDLVPALPLHRWAEGDPRGRLHQGLGQPDRRGAASSSSCASENRQLQDGERYFKTGSADIRTKVAVITVERRTLPDIGAVQDTGRSQVDLLLRCAGTARRPKARARPADRQKSSAAHRRAVPRPLRREEDTRRCWQRTRKGRVAQAHHEDNEGELPGQRLHEGQFQAPACRHEAQRGRRCPTSSTGSFDGLRCRTRTSPGDLTYVRVLSVLAVTYACSWTPGQPRDRRARRRSAQGRQAW